MKTSRIFFVVIVSLLAVLTLSSCSGASVYHTWPGVSAKDGVVYLSYLNGVFAVKDGTMLWRFPEKADGAKSFFAPAVFTPELVVTGDYANHIYGINPQSGVQAWAFASEGGHFVSSPLVVGDTILAPSSNHSLYALDLAGNSRWTYRTGNVLWSQPASDGEVVYLAAMDHFLYALSLAEGEVVWKKDLGGALPSSPVLSEDGALYVATIKGQVFAIDTAEGDTLWTTDLEGEVWSAPVLVGDSLYVGSSSGRVALISRGDGQVQKETSLGSAVIGGGVVYGEGVVFPTEAGVLFALDGEGQTTSWKATVNGKLYSTPVVVGDNVVAAVMEGEKILAAFGPDGAEAWFFATPK